MTKASVTDSPSDTLTSAAVRMWEQQTGSLLVLDDDLLVGIVTERDVMKAVARGHDLAATPVRAVMTSPVLTVTPRTPLHEAAALMAGRWIRHLPVLEGDRLVGVVSQRDLVEALAVLAADPQAGGLRDEELARSRRMSRLGRGRPAPVSSGGRSVLPQASGDETAVGWGDDEQTNDHRLARERPPHYE